MHACVRVRPANLLQEVALEADEVVGLHDVGAALAAEHPGEERLHGGRALPRAHHGVGDLRSTMGAYFTGNTPVNVVPCGRV